MKKNKGEFLSANVDSLSNLKGGTDSGSILQSINNNSKSSYSLEELKKMTGKDREKLLTEDEFKKHLE